jgi:hypothetical protein
MIGAAMRRCAGLGSATALVFALAAGSGCAGPAARSMPEQGQPGASAVVPKPASARVSLPRVRGGLPWPVVLQTADSRYVIARSGAIHPLRAAAQRTRARVHYPAGFVWVNRLSGTWAMMRRGHLLIVRNGAVIWRSAARYAVQDAAHMGVIVAGRPGIAFEVRQWGPLFMAGWHGPEHRVAAAGWPEMWTRSGNLIAVLHRRGSRTFGYAVLSPSGDGLATLATGLRVGVVDQRDDDLGTGTFWFLTGNGDLLRTDGVATWVVASSRALGLTGIPEVGVVGGGLIQFLSAGWREGQVVLYPDGRVFARIPAPPKGQVGGFGELSVGPGNRMVAYILIREPAGVSTVFVVRPGGAPVAVYRTARGSSPCALPPLAWHGSWLLYTPRGGRAVLIDAAGSHRVIRLPAALPGSNGRPARVEAVSWR